MSALALAAIVFALVWVVVAERRKRFRWREAERLSRCLFAAAGMKRGWR